MEFRTEEILIDKEVSIFKELLGVNTYQIYCPSMTVNADNVIVARSFSVSHKDDWFNITNVWMESPNDTTYHALSVEKSDKPKGIKYDMAERSVHVPVSSVILPTNQSIIQKIEVYSMHEKLEEEEDILYDYGLVFCFENGYQFSINVYEESIADELEILREAEQIKKRYRETKLRLIIA